MNILLVHVMKDFYDLFSASLFLKEPKLHMHFGPNHFFTEFLKSAKFVTDLTFSGSELYI